jgi:hypothetical protein
VVEGGSDQDAGQHEHGGSEHDDRNGRPPPPEGRTTHLVLDLHATITRPAQVTAPTT